jgi:hypothetical protein
MDLKSPKLSTPSRPLGPPEDNLPPRQPSKFQQTARFVVSVDHQNKSSFDVRQDAEAEAARILGLFPIVTVAVHDVKANSIDTLGPTVGKEEEEVGDYEE